MNKHVINNDDRISKNTSNKTYSNRSTIKEHFVFLSNSRSLFYICSRAILGVLTFWISEYIITTIASNDNM